MTHEAELAQALDRIWEKGNERNWILGRLGTETGANEDIDVAGRPGYVVVSLGAAGNLGVGIAIDRVGALRSNFQAIKMRRENGELVIREAAATAGGSGGGGGSDTLAGLSDVQLTSPASGNALQYNGTKWVNVIPAGGAGGAPSPHAHESSHHTGLLNWATVNKSGSSLADLTDHAHGSLSGISPDQHHPHVHPLVGTDGVGVAQHTATGLTPGYTLRATSPTTFAWAQLQHDDLGGIGANQHHAQLHNITGPDHTIAGAAFDLVGAVATNTLGLLTPTHTPGAAARILKTDGFGGLALDTTLFVVDGQTDQVTIGAGLMVADATVNKWVGINRAPNGAALDIIAAKTTDITQRIKQKAGQTSRLWRIEDSAGAELIVLDSQGNLQSGNPGFYSGLMGWQISHTGNAEFNDIWARGELHASVFVKDEIHASGGTLIVATAGKLHADAIINAAVTDNEELQVYSSAAGFPSATTDPLTIVTTSATFEGTTLFTAGVGNRIEIDDPASGPGFYFSPGEIIRVKTEIDQKNSNSDLRLASLWLEVMSATQADGYSIYSVTKRSGSDCTIPAGTAVVSYGQRGDGRILMTSDLNYAPYIDVFTTGENPWAGGPGDIIPRMRMGRLDGVGMPGVSGIPQYGMIAGSDLTDANSGYLVASNKGIRLVKVPIILNNGISNTGYWAPDGNLYVGKNVGDPYNGDEQPTTTGLRVITTGSQGGNVIIGDEAKGNYLRWSQANGTLTVAGSLLVQDPGTTVTQKYVDDQDKIYDAKADLSATGYAGLAKTQSQAYFEARRVNKVGGTWSSPAANMIAWASVAIHFSNNTSRVVTNGQLASTMSVRTYLFIDLGDTVGNLDLIESTSPLINNVNYVLIAVCDPGTPKASVNVVAGGTYISGGNIFTNSINADRIVAGSITTDRMTANTINGDRITFNTLQGDKIVAGTITTGNMTANTINGDRIAFNTLQGDKIIAGTVSADAIAATTLSAIQSSTGVLIVNNNGAIFSAGKSSYGNGTAGFFLGYDGVSPVGYKFNIGNANNWLKWDGDELLIQTIVPINIKASILSKVFDFTSNNGGAVSALTFDNAGVLGTPSTFSPARIITGGVNSSLLTMTWPSTTGEKEVIAFEFGGSRRAIGYNSTNGYISFPADIASPSTIFSQALILTGSFWRVGQSAPPAGAAGGTAGDIRWSWDGANAYIHVCVASNLWRRAVLLNY